MFVVVKVVTDYYGTPQDVDFVKLFNNESDAIQYNFELDDYHFVVEIPHDR